MFIHNFKLNPCKCGCKNVPDLDSDDMHPSWAVQCYACGQMQHDTRWTLKGAVEEWNKANQLLPE